MSWQLLSYLNGGKNGYFSQWLAGQNSEPRIAWYPSAGMDFRDLLFLSKAYQRFNPAQGGEPEVPDIFIHTDYFPWDRTSFLDSRRVYGDDRTTIYVEQIEELPRRDLTLDPQIVHFPDGSLATGRVIFLLLRVNSNLLGEYKVPVLYVFSENAAFCSELALPNQAKFSHIIHVRFGSGFGGGNSTGVWLLNVLKKLSCELLISDNHYYVGCGDIRIFESFPELAGSQDHKCFKVIRMIPGSIWSNH